MTLKNPYWTAGTLEGKAYIERDADLRLRRELSENQRFLFVYGPRHSGTSSLITHCMDSLSPGQYCCTRVDLSKLPHTDYQTFVGALLETVAQDTALDAKEILTEFPEDTILAWLSTFPQKLILFLDEAQSISHLPFKDQVFGKLRFLFNVRVENEQFTRLQVVVSGAVHPDRLIPANLSTPFSGGAIHVPLLTAKQVEKLSWDLESAEVQIDPGAASLLFAQTAGGVHLCQLVLHTLWEDAISRHASVSVSDVERAIDRLVANSANAPHFTAIYQTLTDSAELLGGFLRFVKSESLDPGLMQDLTMTGLCDAERPYICPIYERVFGPNGPLDLGLARMRHSQVTLRIAGELLPSQTTPQVDIKPPREARREYSLVSKLPTAPSGMTPETEGSIELPPLPVPLPLPGVAVLPEPPLQPAAPQLILEAEPSASQMAPVAPLSSQATPKGLGQPSLTVHTKPTAEMRILAVTPPPEPEPGESSGEIVEIDQSQEEDPTWVEDPVKQMSDQLAAAKAAAVPTVNNASEDRRIAEVRSKVEQRLLLSAELDSFCASFFPHVAQKFAPGMSRAEKTDLLMALVAANEINKRLREWSSRLEQHQDVVSSVVASSSSAPGSGGERGQSSQKSSPRGSDPSVIEEPANYRPPMNSMQVGVGLVLANRYFLTSEVGQGPVAVVWNAYDRIKDEQVALKIIHGPAAEKPAVLEAFWRSAQQMSALSHPAIVGVLNKPREEGDIHYVVMEYLPGGNLRQWVQGGKLNRSQLLRVLSRIGAGLQYAHERRVMHRNIKPSNILFDSTGHARLTDFNVIWPADMAGNSEARSDRLTYMAPEEQLGGGTGDPRSDVYSLGMCALYAVYGKDMPSRVVQDRTSFIDHLDATPALKAVLRRATAPSPTERFANAAEFCRALEFDSPALPGISVRNSVPIGIERTQERSGPSELYTSLPPSSARPAPSLPVTPLAMPPPLIPDAPRSVHSPAIPPMQMVSPPSQPAYDGRQQPPLPIELRGSRRDPDSGEIPPPPGHNPRTLAEYGISTDRVNAVMAASVLQPVDITPPLLRPRPRRWQPLAFAGVALLALGGGGLGYYWSLSKTTSADSRNGDPQAGKDNGTQLAYRQPLRVEPLHMERLAPPPEVKTDVPPGKPLEKPADTLAGTKVAINQIAPTGSAKKPATNMATQPPVATSPKLTAIGPATGTQPKQIALAPMTKAKLEPAAKPIGKLALATEPKPTQTAIKPIGPTVLPPTQPKKAVVADVQPIKPVAKPTMVALAPTTKPKQAPPPAVVPQQKPVVHAEAPIHKAAPIKRQPSYTPRPLPPPPSPIQQMQRPIPTPAPPPTQSSSAEAEAALQSAQQAFVRGQHQQAITMAMQVTARGGTDALKAWRFVGGAACSIKSAQLATSAYNHLRDPAHRQLLVDLCRRNGLQLVGGQFSVDE